MRHRYIPPDATSHRRCLDSALELLLALNIAFAIDNYFLYVSGGVFVPEFHLEQVIYHQWGIQAGGGAVSGYLAFAMFVAGITLGLLLPMLVFRRSLLIRRIVFYVAGFIAVSLAPVYELCAEHREHWGWSPAEIVVCLAAAVLYFLRGRAIPVWVPIGIAALHYGFWYVRSDAFGRSVLVLALPLLGFCLWITWVACLRMEDSPSNVTFDG